MAKSRVRARAEKTSSIDDLATKLQQAEIAVLTEYRGLKVSDLQDLRGRLRNAGVEYVVAKNTLARFAAERTGRTSIVDGPDRADRDRLWQRSRSRPPRRCRTSRASIASSC